MAGLQTSRFLPQLSAADWSVIARSLGQLGSNWFARQIRLPYRFRRKFLQSCFLLRRGGRVNARVARIAELRREFTVVLAWILAGARGNFRRQQVHDQPILVSGPDRAVETQKTRSSALFPAEAARAIDQTWHEPLEAHRHFQKPASELLDHPVNHAAAHQRFSNRHFLMPPRSVGEQVSNSNGKVM